MDFEVVEKLRIEGLYGLMWLLGSIENKGGTVCEAEYELLRKSVGDVFEAIFRLSEAVECMNLKEEVRRNKKVTKKGGER